jgi:HEAT repeats
MADVYDEFGLLGLRPRERIEKAMQIYQSQLKEGGDESQRWDMFLVLQATAEEVKESDQDLFNLIGKNFATFLSTDPNGFIRHEAGFQLGYNDMHEHTSVLVASALTDEDDVVRHECVEGLGLIRYPDVDFFKKIAESDPHPGVRETANVFLKRAKRLNKAAGTRPHIISYTKG